MQHKNSDIVDPVESSEFLKAISMVYQVTLLLYMSVRFFQANSVVSSSVSPLLAAAQ